MLTEGTASPGSAGLRAVGYHGALPPNLFDALLSRLRNQPAMDIGPWTRDELNEDEEK